MPSLLHEALVVLLRNRPALVPELLREALDAPVPAHNEVRLQSETLGEISPTEYRADLVVLLLRGRPVLGVVVEIQLRGDEDKRYSWPVYLAVLRARLRCPTCLLVVTADERVADWCRRPIEMVQPGWRLAPLVLGPRAVPVVTRVQRAREAPELAVLSAVAHGSGAQAVPVALAALGAAVGLDEERARLHADVVHASLNEAARVALEKLMQTGKYEYMSEFARRYVAQGRAQGRAQGVAKGIAKGRAEGLRQGLLAALEAKLGTVGPELRRQVAAVGDAGELARLLARVAAARDRRAVLAALDGKARHRRR